MEIIVRFALISEIEKIKPYIEEFWLDNEDLYYHKFYIAEINGEPAGFGRIKRYGSICELATLGVLEQYREKGVGKKLVNELIQSADCGKIWLTTVVPEYFKQFGFAESKDIPDEILMKARRVCNRMHRDINNSSYMCLDRTKAQLT